MDKEILVIYQKNNISLTIFEVDFSVDWPKYIAENHMIFAKAEKNNFTENLVDSFNGE